MISDNIGLLFFQQQKNIVFPDGARSPEVKKPGKKEVIWKIFPKKPLVRKVLGVTSKAYQKEIFRRDGDIN